MQPRREQTIFMAGTLMSVRQSCSLQLSIKCSNLTQDPDLSSPVPCSFPLLLCASIFYLSDLAPTLRPCVPVLQFRAAASAATKLIAEACDTAFDDAIESLPRILVLEGLERARKAEERMNGTSQREVRELHLLCDMLVSCLLLSHPTVTVWKSQNEEETRHYAFALVFAPVNTPIHCPLNLYTHRVPCQRFCANCLRRWQARVCRSQALLVV